MPCGKLSGHDNPHRGNIMLFRNRVNLPHQTVLNRNSKLKVKLTTTILAVPVVIAIQTTSYAAPSGNAAFDSTVESAAHCRPDLLAFPNHSQADADGISPIVVEADDVQTQGKEKVNLKGNAFVAQGRQSITGENIEYDRENDKVKASGGVELRSVSGDLVQADAIDLDVNSSLGTAKNAKFKLAKRGTITAETNAVEVQSRGSAKSVSIEGEDFVRLKGAVYTTCVEGQNDFYIKASELELDRATGVGTAKHARFVFFRVPFFYFPRVSFPISDKRKTGFLFPTFGTDSESGFFFGTPWYWNIAPNADATITPKIFTDRGVQLGVEFRHLSKHSETEINAEVLPSDDQFDDETRAFIAIDHEYDITEKLTLTLDINDVSDTEYFRDFRTNITAFSSTFTPSEARLRYVEDNWDLSLRTVTFEVIDDAVTSEPFDLLPELRFNNRYEDIAGTGINYRTRASATNFRRDIEGIEGVEAVEAVEASEGVEAVAAVAAVEAVPGGTESNSRILVNPSIERPFENAWGYIKPKFEIDYAAFSEEGVDDRTAPIFSIDSGLFLERRVNFRDGKGVQTLEPRIFYVNSDSGSDNNDLTTSFDTVELDFNNFNDLFSTTGFTGGDSVADGQRLTLALATRFFDADGDQRFRAQIGQVYFIDELESTDSEGIVTTQDESDILVEIDYDVNDDLKIGTFLGYGDIDGSGDEIRNADFNIDYEPSVHNFLKFSYRLNRDLASDNTIDETGQFIAQGSWKLNSQWRIFGTQRYDIEDSESIQTQFGAEYDACCWSLTLTADRLRESDDEFRNALFAQIEFAGFGRIRTGFQ